MRRTVVVGIVSAACVGLLGTALGQEGEGPIPLAHFRFPGKVQSEVKGGPRFDTRNVTFKEGALHLDGLYGLGASDGYLAACRTPKLDFGSFTVGVRFKPEDFGIVPNVKKPATKTNLIVGGPLYRWFTLFRAPSGNLAIAFNNRTATQEFRGAPIEKGKWSAVACAVDVPKRKVVAYLNGKKVGDIALPKTFKLVVPEGTDGENDKVWNFTNYSTGETYHGLVDEFVVYDRPLPTKDLERWTQKKK